MFLSRVVLDSTIAFSFWTLLMMGFQDSFSGDPKMLKAARVLRFGGFTTSGDFSPGLSGLNPQVTKNWRHNSIALGNLPFFVDFFGISLFKDLHISYIMYNIYLYIHIYHTYLQFHGVILCKFWLQGLWQPFEVWLREAEGWNHRRDNDMFLLDRA